jgi:outer membrane protein TolC
MKQRTCTSIIVAVTIGCAASAAAQDRPAPGTPPPAAVSPSRVEADLPALVAQALRRNLRLEGERMTPEIARAAAGAARAGFEPTLQFSPGFAFGRETIQTAAGPVTGTTRAISYANGLSGALPYSSLAVAGSLPTGTRYSVALDLARRSESPARRQDHGVEVDSQVTVSFAQPVLRGAGTSIARAEIRAADLSARAAMRRFSRLEEETVSAVEQAYWALAQAEASEAVERESLERAVALWTRNEQLVRLGLVPEVDLLTAQQAVAVREASVTETARLRRDAAEALIFRVYGREASDRLATAGQLGVRAPVVPPLVPPLEQVEAEALRRRPDLIAARDDVAVGGVRVEIARSDLEPSLQLTGSYTAAVTNAARLRLWGTDRMGDAAVTGWQGGLVLTVPVGNGLGKAGYRQATLARSQQEAAVAALENDIRLQVRRAGRAILEGTRRLTQTEAALALARRQYDAENRRLALGLTDSFRLLQVEQVVADASRAVIEARSALASAISDYHLAIGGNAERYVHE